MDKAHIALFGTAKEVTRESIADVLNILEDTLNRTTNDRVQRSLVQMLTDPSIKTVEPSELGKTVFGANVDDQIPNALRTIRGEKIEEDEVVSRLKRTDFSPTGSATQNKSTPTKRRVWVP